LLTKSRRKAQSHILLLLLTSCQMQINSGLRSLHRSPVSRVEIFVLSTLVAGQLSVTSSVDNMLSCIIKIADKIVYIINYKFKISQIVLQTICKLTFKCARFFWNNLQFDNSGNYAIEQPRNCATVQLQQRQQWATGTTTTMGNWNNDNNAQLRKKRPLKAARYVE
jgi:hypothetical protein